MNTRPSDRNMDRPAVGKWVSAVCISWSLWQLWYTSPLPFLWQVGIVNDTQARSIHLLFALLLAFMVFPAYNTSPKRSLPRTDGLLALIASASAGYLYCFHQALALRAGAPTTVDLITAGVGMVLLLEATRRVLGCPLMVVAMVFLGYAFAGPWMPDSIAHKGVSLKKALTHFWLTTEGVFGVALGVATNFVFLFVLFGALLEKAGAGHYFIQVAFALLGHLRGGPAKAAVIASGFSGIASGSSIANVVTTGTFTIPLMKQAGFPAHKAGAIEVAASTNGQLMPPVMGAAAFLMAEYIGISYLEVIRHALLPAIISYAALFYVVHLEAVKAGMQGTPRRRTLTQALLSFTGTFAGLGILALVIYYGMGWTRALMDTHAGWLIAVVLLISYGVLVFIAAKQPPWSEKNPSARSTSPALGPTLKSGLYFLLPLVVLLWCLMVARFSPGLAVFWAIVILAIITVTHKGLLQWCRQPAAVKPVLAGLQAGGRDLVNSLVSGARNMIGISIATATAGIVVGTVTLTGLSLVMTEFVQWLAGDSVLLLLLLTAFICLILGLGLPTTTNYIVVSTLMAPVIVTLGAQHGLAIPLVAAHLFVFYFGILADDTPPVGLAALAAAAIAKAKPLPTGLQGFAYDLRTAILPFMFLFNTELLLIGVDNGLHLILVVASALLAMLVFVTATQGYWLTRTRWYETIGLLVIAFTLFNPGFWWDRLQPPFHRYTGQPLLSALATVPAHHPARLWVAGTTLAGKPVTKLVTLPAGPQASSHQRLRQMGLAVDPRQPTLTIASVDFNSPAQQAGIAAGWTVAALEVPNPHRWPKESLWLPALLLLLLLYWHQRQRVRRRQAR